MPPQKDYLARPDSLAARHIFPERVVEAKSVQELAALLRGVLSASLAAVIVGGHSAEARQLCEDALEAGMLREGDTLTVIGGLSSRKRDEATASPFGDWFDRARKGPLRARSVDWQNATHRQRLRTRTYDLIFYAAEHVEEALAYRVLSRHASLSIVNHPTTATKPFQAIAKEATVNMGPTFAKAPLGVHCIPLVTKGTPKSVDRFVALAVNCREHTQSSCSTDCPAFVASEILQPVLLPCP